MTDVLKQDVQRLQELHADVTTRLLPQDVEEKRKHVLLQEKAGKKEREREKLQSVSTQKERSL